MNHTQISPVTTSAPLTPAALAFDPAILAGQLAASSIDKYAQDFRAYLAYAGTPEAALDPATLARWRAVLAADTSLSPNTINPEAAWVRLRYTIPEQGTDYDYPIRLTSTVPTSAGSAGGLCAHWW